MTRPSNEEITRLDSLFHERLCAEIRASYPQYMAAAIDMFARDGAMAIRNFQDLTWEAWEIDPVHQPALEALGVVPGNIYIGDTFHIRYLDHALCDMVWVDAPQGTFKDNKGSLHSEHFELLEDALALLRGKGLLVLYVNKQPYNKEVTGDYGVDTYPEYSFEGWMARRRAFYGKEFITDAEALVTYDRVMDRLGWSIKSTMMFPCLTNLSGMPPSFRLVLEVQEKI